MEGTTHDALAEDRAETEIRIRALERDLGRVVEATELVATDDEHDPEGSTIAYDRAQLGALLDQARQHLVEIDSALERLTAGTYGGCLTCGVQIPTERLAARPATRTCVECAARTP